MYPAEREEMKMREWMIQKRFGGTEVDAIEIMEYMASKQENLGLSESMESLRNLEKEGLAERVKGVGLLRATWKIAAL